MRTTPIAFIIAPLFAVVACAGGASNPTPTGGEPAAVAPAPAAVAPAATPAPSASERAREDITFSSAALGVDKPLVVFLPPGYETSAKRYPVVYMLHGLGGWQESWARLGIGETADAVGLEAIIVLPDGDDSFYVNWNAKVDYAACLAGRRPFGLEPEMKTYCVKQARYADYLTADLISFIDGKYRTIATRDGRAIGGLSMGGYGALVTAFRRPDLFSAVASHAGIASLRYLGPDPFVSGGAKQFDDPELVIKGSAQFGGHFAKVFGTDIEAWKARDPVALAATLEEGQLAIYFDAGTEDFFRLHNGAAHLDEVLTARGIAHEFHLIEGGKHDASFWKGRIDDSLEFFAARLTPAR